MREASPYPHRAARPSPASTDRDREASPYPSASWYRPPTAPDCSGKTGSDPSGLPGKTLPPAGSAWPSPPTAQSGGATEVSRYSAPIAGKRSSRYAAVASHKSISRHCASIRQTPHSTRAFPSPPFPLVRIDGYSHPSSQIRINQEQGVHSPPAPSTISSHTPDPPLIAPFPWLGKDRAILFPRTG